jgi:hypothetical protein
MSIDIGQILVSVNCEISDATWSKLWSAAHGTMLRRIGDEYEPQKAVIGGVNVGVVWELEGIRRMGFIVDDFVNNEPLYNVGDEYEPQKAVIGGVKEEYL